MGFLAVAIVGCVLPSMCSAYVNECKEDEVVIVLPNWGKGIMRILGPLVCCCAIGRCAYDCKAGEMSSETISCLAGVGGFIVVSVVLTSMCNPSVGDLIGIFVGSVVGICCLCGCCLYCISNVTTKQRILKQNAAHLTEKWQADDEWDDQASMPLAAHLLVIDHPPRMREMVTLREGQIYNFEPISGIWQLVVCAEHGARTPEPFPIKAIAASASFFYAISEKNKLWQQELRSPLALEPSGWGVVAAPFDVSAVAASGVELYVVSDDGKLYRTQEHGREQSAYAWAILGDADQVSAIAVGRHCIYGVKGGVLHELPKESRDEWRVTNLVNMGTFLSVAVVEDTLYALEEETVFECCQKKASQVAPMPIQPLPPAVGLRSEAARADAVPTNPSVANEVATQSEVKSE